MPPGENHKDSVLSHPFAGEPDEPLPDVGRKGPGPANVEAQANGGGHLVHVLAARARGPDELECDLGVINGDGSGHADHERPDRLTIETALCIRRAQSGLVIYDVPFVARLADELHGGLMRGMLLIEPKRLS